MSVRRAVGNVALGLLPSSKLARLRQTVLRLMGVELATTACVSEDCYFFGDGEVAIGEGTWVGPGCRFYVSAGVRVSIGKNCDIAPEVAFVTGTHELGGHERRAGSGKSDSIIVGDGCWIGVRSTLLGGARVGAGSVVGATSLVTGVIAPDVLSVGAPARTIRYLETVAS